MSATHTSALQGSLAAGSAAGGVIYDAKEPGGALGVAAAVAAAGSLTLLGRPARASALRQQASEIWPASGAGKRRPRRKALSMEQERAHTNTLKLPFAAISTLLLERKELLCPTQS